MRRTRAHFYGNRGAPELIVNGDFSNGGTWTLSSAAIGGGTLNANVVGSVIFAFQPVVFVAGGIYRVIFTVSAYVSGDFECCLGVGTNVFGTARSANGTYQEDLVSAPGGNAEFRFISNGAGLVASIDNVSVKRIG